MKTPMAETISSAHPANCFMALSAASACSYTFIKEPGYKIVLSPYENSWQAMVHDNRFPGLSRSYAAAVIFEKGYRLDDFITKNFSWQSRHIHIIARDKDRSVVYIGSFGLKGGGNAMPTTIYAKVENNYNFNSHSCRGNVWTCVCGFKCPNNDCQSCCDHIDSHKCAGCGTRNRCPRYYKCRTCYSTGYCYNCCGCYERQQQLKLQQERERQEQLKQKRERERQEQLKKQQERERQEQIRQQKEKERKVVLSKLDNSLAAAPTARKNTSNTERNTSKCNAGIVDQVSQGDTYAFVHQVFTVQDWNNQAAYTDQTIDSDTDSPSLTRNNSSDSINSSYKPYESYENNKEAIHHENNLVLSLGRADSSKNNQTNQESELSDTKLTDSIQNSISQSLVSNVSESTSRISSTAGSVDSSLIASFLANYTTHLSSEELTHFYQEAGKFLKENLLRVDIALRQAIIDYFTNEGPLYPYVVQHYPVSEWIGQSLLIEVVSDSDENDPSLNCFRAKWLKIKENYSTPDQVALLKNLKIKKDIHNLSLLDVNNILDLILHTGSPGYDIVCSKQDKWLFDLKANWLQPKLAVLTKFSMEELNKLSSFLADLDWGIDMMQHFLKSIQNEILLDPVLELLSTIKKHHIPESLVLPIIIHDLSGSDNNKVLQWIHTIIYQSLNHKIRQFSNVIAEYISPILPKLFKNYCLDTFDLVSANIENFVKVLELFYDYQVTEDICTLAFFLLPEIPPSDWVDNIDALISLELFQAAKIYTTDELIERIATESSAFTFQELKASYDGVIKTYRSPSVLLESVSDPLINSFKNKPIAEWNKTELSLWAKQVKSSNNSKSLISQSELIAGVKRSVELHHRFSPRDTQILSLLTLLNPGDGMGRLAQINTGEGKSLIVAMFAAIHALRGKKVDVVTTSTELSIPEVKKQEPFFKSLSLTVAENSSMEKKRSAYESDIVYGTSGDFQADILQTEFLGKDIKGNRGFDIVIVDEVDSMLFDNRSHSVRLSDLAPGMTHLELPLAAIWEHMMRIVRHMTTINDQTFFIPEDFERKGDEITLYSDQDWESCAIPVEDKRSFITEQTQRHLNQLLRELDDEEKSEYEIYKALNNQLITFEEEISNTTIAEEKEKKEADYKSMTEKLKTLSWSQRYPVLDVPVHLRNFARSQTPYWIKNALNAAYGYKKGAHYTVQEDRIVPIHYNETGVLQSNMVWSDGLTQFLQLKEGLRMDPEGVSTNSISNVSFFQHYGCSIYGLTGTLGGKSTKDFLHQIYHTDTIIIPPYQHREIIDNAHSPYLCKELVPIVLTNKTEWFQTIIDHVLIHAKRQRAVLIICKYISQVKNLANELCKQYDAKNIFTYTGEDATFEKRKIDSGEIIIATNIAGRGTDLETTPFVESNGGMYVAVTFLPESFRVEMQNVGRTARAGKKGMAQLIICDPIRSNIKDIKKHRDTQEVLATEKAIQDAEKMLLQDNLFSAFCSLEREYLPAVSVIWLVRKWKDLTIAWRKHASEALSPVKIAKHVNQKILDIKGELIELSLGSLSNEEKSKITEDDKQIFLEKTARKAESERPYFEEQYKKQVLNAFCNAQSHVPKELITCLKECREFEPKVSALAKKYSWGVYDRKGFEEDWGFWLKGEHFEEKDISLENALDRFNTAFATPARSRALNDQLVRNPFFYVLKGNEYMVHGDLESAISCYDRAITMDPDFSVNARYNKAQALLSYEENEGERQMLAYEELKKAKEIIGTISRPALLTFNALITQHGSKIQTSEHVQHQLNLLGQQENYIIKACAVIEETRSKGYHVKLSSKTIVETLNESDGDHSQSIREANVNGFTSLFVIEKKEPYPWGSIIGLALISIAQIAAGCLITACTGGSLGTGLIVEGISDVITTVKAAVEGSFDWAAWAIQKSISLAISLVSCSFQSLKNGCRAVVNTTKDLIGKAAVGAAKDGVKLAVRSVATAVAKGVVKECLLAAGEWFADKLFMENLEKLITEQVEKSIMEALLNNPLVVKALELDVKNGNNCWQQCFIEEGLSLLKEQKEHVCLTMLYEISKGVAKNKKMREATLIFKTAEFTKMTNELTNYTNDFLKKFNAKVQDHKSDIESAVQKTVLTHVSSTVALKEEVSSSPDIDLEETDIVIDSEEGSTVYNSKQVSNSSELKLFYKETGPSNPKSIVDTFKAEITNKLTNVVKTNLINPAIACGVNWSTKAIFRETDKVTDKMRETVRTGRDRRYYSNQLALTAKKEQKKKEKKAKQTNKGRIVTASRERNKTKLNASTQKGLQKLERDVPLDSNDLALLAAVANAPIRVYDKNTGKLVDVVGDNLPGKHIPLLHTTSNGSNPGHWEPVDGNIQVESSGANSCLVDAVFAQLDQDKKKVLRDVNGLKKKMINVVYKNPEKANKAYETRDKLARIAPDQLRIGGRLPRNEKEWEKIDSIKKDLLDLSIKAKFDNILKSKGEGVQFLSKGKAEDDFEKLKNKFNIPEDQITHYSNGAKAFTYENKTFTLRRDSRGKSARNGKTISIKKGNDLQQTVIRYDK